jgi:hypothetical protein
MSEMKDLFFYNFYDYMKTVYVYSHLKTYLVDKQRQKIEEKTLAVLLGLIVSFLILSALKFMIIFFYFLFIQALTSFCKFLKTLCKTKFNVNFCSSFRNAMSYLWKVLKRVYTFNFYVFGNRLNNFIMVVSYFFLLITSCTFFVINNNLLSEIEKSESYLVFFYLHFEAIIFCQLLNASFYSKVPLTSSIIYSFGLFLTFNGILFFGYHIKNIYENRYGSFEYEEPQSILNIIFNSILFLLNFNCLIRILIHKKNGK